MMYPLAPANRASEMSSWRSDDDSITTRIAGHSFAIDLAASNPLPGIETSSSMRSTGTERAISRASSAEPPSHTTRMCGSWLSTSRTHFRKSGWSSTTATRTTRFSSNQGLSPGKSIRWPAVNSKNAILEKRKVPKRRDRSRVSVDLSPNLQAGFQLANLGGYNPG